MRLDSVPQDQFVVQVVVPLMKALANHGLHANLKAADNTIIQNEGDLSYALFPGGDLGFFYTTGPTFNTISGSTDAGRYMLTTIARVPGDVGIAEADVSQAIAEFQAGLAERGIVDTSARVQQGGSVSGTFEAGARVPAPLSAVRRPAVVMTL
jgi:hypothetical protein